MKHFTTKQDEMMDYFDYFRSDFIKEEVGTYTEEIDGEEFSVTFVSTTLLNKPVYEVYLFNEKYGVTKLIDIVDKNWISEEEFESEATYYIINEMDSYIEECLQEDEYDESW